MARTSLLVGLAAVMALVVVMPQLVTFANAAHVSRAKSAGVPLMGTVDMGLVGHRVGLKTDDETVAREEEAMSADGMSVKERRVEQAAEQFEFQAEVSRLMDIIINSLYTKREIFLRELISNASDALDKIRFQSLSDASVLGTGEAAELDIRVSFDPKERTVTLRDKGIGMTKQDLINNLGTVAKSGTSAFMESIGQAGDSDMSLIGQFGVGFYSVYLVADRVRVASKHNDDPVQHIWESKADGHFTVVDDPAGDTLGRGTAITLYLKEDASEFLDEETLRGLLQRYSEFITFPIYLWATKTETVDVPVEDADDAAVKDAEAVKTGDDTPVAEDEEEVVTRTEERQIQHWELINGQKAIWTRNPSEIKDEEYLNFYDTISKDKRKPLTWIHFKAEGEVEFRAILYVPSEAPYDLYEDYYGKSNALRLYVRRVLITDEFEDLIPRYLNFIKGVVDSNDLPLNVSRETLQQDKVLKVMGKKLVRKTLEMLRKLAQDGAEEAARKAAEAADAAATPTATETAAEGEKKDEEKKEPEDDQYTKFWKVFGKNIKLGLIEDAANRTKLAKLLRFRSSTSNGKLTSLEEYVARMKPTQKVVYYIAGESTAAVEATPFLDKFRTKGLEVLYMTDPMDEYALQQLPEFDGHKLQSITKEGLEFGDEADLDRRRMKVYNEEFKPILLALKRVYGDTVERVKISNRLENVPCALVTTQYGYSANMERIMKAQAFNDPERAKHMLAKRVLEINPRHPIIVEMNNRVKERPADAVMEDDLADVSRLLLDTAMLNSGFDLEDARGFMGRVQRVLKQSLALDSLDLTDEIAVPTEEDEEAREAANLEDLDSPELDFDEAEDVADL